MAIPKNLLWTGGAATGAAVAGVIVYVIDVANIPTVEPPRAPVAVLAPSPPVTAAPAPAAKPDSPTLPARPSFDVARVSPQGEVVVAGRAEPNVAVALLDQGRPIAGASADANGQFVIVPPTLTPGDHLLSLRAGSADRPIDSDQSVAAVVPDKPGGAAVAALTSPTEPTRVLSQTPPAAPPASAPAPAAPTGVSIRAADAGEDGSFFASGVAAAGAAIRLYLNNAYVAAVKAGDDGAWSLKVERGMSPGHYDIRADVVTPGDGKVIARAQAPFDYPETPKSAAGRPATTTPAATPGREAVAGTPPGAVVVPDLRTVTVVRGDSLWRISRRVLGQGVRYTQIYEANAAQIRDPDLIWPGQVFVTPPSQPN